jgi:integrase
MGRRVLSPSLTSLATVSNRRPRRPLSAHVQMMPPSRLRDAALGSTTLRAYNDNVNKFLHHTRLSLRQLLTLPPFIIDRRLALFIDHMFEHGGSYSYACQAVFGLIYRCPSLKYKLGETRLRLRGWSNLKECHSHPPLTWELAVLFASTMSKWGLHAHAVATLLGFDCYLRVNELTSLTYRDIIQDNDPRVGAAHSSMAVRLAKTKTGLNQWVSLNRTSVASVLKLYLAQSPFLEHQRIFPFTAASFRRVIRRVSVSLGLGHIPYVAHSLRHGGATSDYLASPNIEPIMYRGRWKSMESARRYIQTGRALLTRYSIPRELNDTGAALAAELLPLFAWTMEHIQPAKTRRRRVRFSV